MSGETHDPQILNIHGYRGQAVPHTFFRQSHDTRHLGLLFPGVDYTAHMPVMYYPGRLLLAQGADVLRVEYAYRQRPDFQSLADDERDRWFFTDVTAAAHAALARREYEKVTLVGKSIGTLAMGHLLTTVPRLPHPQCVWLTPLLRRDRLLAQIKQVKHRALFVIGSSDPHYDAAKLAEIERATGGETVVIDGADHSLEIKGEVLQSVQVLERIMNEIERFLRGVPRRDHA